MKISQIYESFCKEVDALQNQMKNNHCEQITITLQLQAKQSQMKEVMQMMITSGDRELTGDEILRLNPSESNHGIARRA